jgi:hypothetical protein
MSIEIKDESGTWNALVVHDVAVKWALELGREKTEALYAQTNRPLRPMEIREAIVEAVMEAATPEEPIEVPVQKKVKKNG